LGTCPLPWSNLVKRLKDSICRKLEVTVLTPEPTGEVQLTPEEEAELLEAMAEVDRGETISAEELFARLEQRAKRRPCGCGFLHVRDAKSSELISLMQHL
jgi:hypothetical protein